MTFKVITYDQIGPGREYFEAKVGDSTFYTLRDELFEVFEGRREGLSCAFKQFEDKGTLRPKRAVKVTRKDVLAEIVRQYEELHSGRQEYRYSGGAE
jgi:hypothetical protein